MPRQAARGRATASEAVDHYAAGKPTFGAAAGYGPNQAPLQRQTPRSGRAPSGRHRQPQPPQSDPLSARNYPATASDGCVQPPELRTQQPPAPPPPPESDFEATVQAGMADLEGIRQQMATLEQPLDALRFEPEPEPEPESEPAAPPGVYAAVRLNHMADLQHSPRHQQSHLEGTSNLPPIGRSSRKQHATFDSVGSSRNSPGRQRSGRRKANKWRPEEELRLAEGVGFFKKTVDPGDWETVAAHVSAENLRGQRPRAAEECRQKWEAIQHGAILHELKLGVRMKDAKRLVETLANAEKANFAGPEVEQARWMLAQLQTGEKALSQVQLLYTSSVTSSRSRQCAQPNKGILISRP